MAMNRVNSLCHTQEPSLGYNVNTNRPETETRFFLGGDEMPVLMSGHMFVRDPCRIVGARLYCHSHRL